MLSLGEGKNSTEENLERSGLLAFKSSPLASFFQEAEKCEPGDLGSCFRQRAKRSELAAVLVEATGRVRFRVASPGIQIFSQTSQLTFAERFAVVPLMFFGGLIY